MIPKSKFQEAIAASISNYPTAAVLYRAKDPRLLAQLDAIATMLSMLSSEIGVAAAEPFTKARDVTVLADASIKGVLPFGSPAIAQLRVANATATPFAVLTGRRILDTQGRVYVVESGATIPANGSALVTAKQRTESSFDHTVTVGAPFYVIAIPDRDPGRYPTDVKVVDSIGTQYTYSPEFLNVDIDQKVFHLFTDEQRQLFIEFGASGLTGFQPPAGEVFTVTVAETEGKIELPAGSKFAFEYTSSPAEIRATIALEEMLSLGSSPMDISTMREVANFPSIYDSSAVYLGNFDFLIRRNLSPFRFLSVWNEQIEEAVRGPSVDNINALFVSATKDGVATATLRAQIEAVVKAADDSYRFKWVTPVPQIIPVQITAIIPSVYDPVATAQQIKEIVLAEYGPDSNFSRKGQTRVLYRRLYDLITAGVQAVQSVTGDLIITVDDDDEIMPESYRYVSEASITVTVEQAP